MSSPGCRPASWLPKAKAALTSIRSALRDRANDPAALAPPPDDPARRALASVHGASGAETAADGPSHDGRRPLHIAIGAIGIIKVTAIDRIEAMSELASALAGFETPTGID